MTIIREFTKITGKIEG